MLAGRFHRLRTGHCPTGQCLEWTKNSDTAECGWCRDTRHRQENTYPRTARDGSASRRSCEQKILWAEVRKETGKWKWRFNIRDLLTDERCARSILDFLHTTKVERRVGPRVVPPKPGEGRTGDEGEVTGNKEEGETEKRVKNRGVGRARTKECRERGSGVIPLGRGAK